MVFNKQIKRTRPIILMATVPCLWLGFKKVLPRFITYQTYMVHTWFCCLFFSIFSFTSWPHGLVCSDSHLHLALSSICLCVLCACGINREQPKISLCLISLIWRKLFLFAQSPKPNSNKNDGKNAHSKRYALGESEMEQVSRVATCMCDTTKWPPWVPFFLVAFFRLHSGISTNSFWMSLV